MTRSRIRCFVALTILVCVVFQEALSNRVERVPSNDKGQQEELAKVEETKDAGPKAKDEVKSAPQKVVPDGQPGSNKTGTITSKRPAESSAAAAPAPTTSIKPPVQHVNEMDISSLNIGALKRAMIVTFGLCGLVMIYMVFRSLRVNKSRPQMVRKYGILAHRQDVEMRPLPLDEDDEDDTTVFDASNLSAQRLET